MAAIKGSVILNARGFVIARDGIDGWRRVLGELADEDRDALATMAAGDWYDMALNDRVNRAIVDGVGGGRMDVMESLGRHSASSDVRTIHRLFLRMASPVFMIERLAEAWGRYHDTGTWTLVQDTETSLTATLRGWGSRDEATCVRLAAYAKRLFELVGARTAVVERRSCEARGDEACVFIGHWG